MLKFIIKTLILYLRRYTDIIITVLMKKENENTKETKGKIVINTMTPNFRSKNKKGEIVKPNTEVSY